MTINKLVYSLAFLVSLSLATVANGNDDLTPIDHLSLKPIGYTSKNHQIIEYNNPETYIKKLETYLEANKETYSKKYENYLMTYISRLPFEKGILVAAAGIFGAFLPLIVSESKEAAILAAGLGIFVAKKYAYNEIPDKCYTYAKEDIRSFIEDDLYNANFLKINYNFPLKDGKQSLDQFIDKLATSFASQK